MHARDVIFATVLVLAGSNLNRSLAAELPIRGIFGDTKNKGCQSVKDEEEGAYVSFNKGGQTAENGEASCVFSSIKRINGNVYKLIGKCRSLEGKPQQVIRYLEIKSQKDIIYDNTSYSLCP